MHNNQCGNDILSKHQNQVVEKRTDVICQAEESLKYDAQRSIFDELRGVSSGNETWSNS